ncbi:MAG: hypothetical protein WAX04_14665, partial [Oscillospiraceae bacterium]
MKLPDCAQKAIEMIEQNSCEAYLVGGCVRDMVMGKAQNDIDITTNMLPDKIEELFSHYKTIGIGKKHGTITVFIDNVPLEITTYRIESGYEDNRHPSNVCFTKTLKEDLSRRDFTMNALCYNDKSGLVDEFFGIQDIQNKCIRAIGEPKKRFSEDALRILRAFRFMAQLSFSIEESTKSELYECRELLQNISAERVTVELTKLLLSDKPVCTLRLMNELCVLENILKPLSQKEFVAIENSNPIIEIRLALALKKEGLDYLCVDKKTKDRTKMLWANQQFKIHPDKQSIKQKLNKLSYEGVLLLLDYQALLGEDVKEQRKLTLEIERTGECYSLKQLKISG